MATPARRLHEGPNLLRKHADRTGHHGPCVLDGHHITVEAIGAFLSVLQPWGRPGHRGGPGPGIVLRYICKELCKHAAEIVRFARENLCHLVRIIDKVDILSGQPSQA